MTATTEMPKELQPCETCGHEPDKAKRYAWLAGCPAGHVFHIWFDIKWLANRLVHEWPDRTYSALSIDGLDMTDNLVLEWLDLAHQGRFERRPAFTGNPIVCDEMVIHRHLDAVTGDVTMTYSFPIVEGG